MGAPTAVAFAQDSDEETGRLIDRGIELRTAGDDAGAREVFDQAFQRSRSAEAQAQRGLAAQALGDWVAAYTDLSAALASGHAWVAENREPLQRSFTVVRGHVALLRIEGPAGARVRVRGEDHGTLPREAIPLAVGAAEVSIEPSGSAPQTQQLTLVAGNNDARFVAGASSGGSSGGGGGPPIGGVVLTVAGAALVVLGVVLLAVGIADVGALQGTPDGTRPWDEVAADRDRAYALEGAGIGGLTLGGIALGVGLGWTLGGESSGASARLAMSGVF